VLHHPAHPDHRGDLIFRQADALAAQVGRRADAGAGADIDAGMAEDARHECRDADIGRGTGGDRPQIARERDFRDVELLELEGAVEDLLRVERQIGDRAAVHLDATVPDRGGPVVIAACDRDGHLDHNFFPRANADISRSSCPRLSRASTSSFYCQGSKAWMAGT
jgi:hypothetical protein